ncbi:hypothetical protein [Natronorubrum halophilum]|uniref:hypothetical protein n=1 Tax=Natronorubrum halophilum TaxID=1702106 RepID=UPI0010C1E5C7|nr:hypothetical protein [Natronorubrum halophilum]
MDWVSASIISILLLWLGVTVVNATTAGSELLSKRMGPLHTLVPKWNFFSPYPGRYDYHLVYRDRYVDGSVTNWQQVSGINRSPGPFRWIWNPHLYRSKALFDIAENLSTNASQQYANTSDADAIEEGGGLELRSVDLGHLELSVLYLTLLRYVTRREHSPLSESTQFLILQHSRVSDRYEPLFLSHFHELER